MHWTKKFNIHFDTKIRLHLYLGGGRFYGYNPIDSTRYLIDCESKEIIPCKFEQQYFHPKFIPKCRHTLVSLNGFEVLVD